MSFNWKSKRLRVAALCFLMGTGATFASAQTTQPTPPAQTTEIKVVDIKATPAAQDPEEARLKKFLDKDGGYKDKLGGYYNPTAGTYTDKDGGVVDNWQGYTYKNGNYKSKIGDFWEASTKTFKLTTGENLKEDLTNAEATDLLRETVAEQGGFDKDYIKKTMMAQVKLEHPLVPVTPKKPN
ncbi:MAG: hypothetical protein ACAH83_00985 [Alphaproteobacteria bacterium]